MTVGADGASAPMGVGRDDQRRADGRHYGDARGLAPGGVPDPAGVPTRTPSAGAAAADRAGPPRRRPPFSPTLAGTRRCLRLSGSTVERLRHSRRVRRRVPRSRAGGRRTPRWRRPRASGPASPTDPKSGNGRLGFSPATGGPAAPAAGDKARPIQVGGPRRHRPRRRGGGSEAEAVARERGRLTAMIAGMRRSEVSARRPPFVVLLKSGCAPMKGSPPQCHVHSVLLHLCCLKH